MYCGRMFSHPFVLFLELLLVLTTMYVIVYYLDRMIYSVKEASSKLGISDAHCRRLLESGQIKGKKLGHDWAVLSLDYKRKRKPRGGKK